MIPLFYVDARDEECTKVSAERGRVTPSGDECGDGVSSTHQGDLWRMTVWSVREPAFVVHFLVAWCANNIDLGPFP